MSLLDRLAGKKPKRQQAAKENELYKLARKYLSEIEELRDRGFMWGEIFEALKAECLENGEWQEEPARFREQWNSYKLQMQYYKIRREALA